MHFLGLVSDGGVHSHQNHLIALVKAAKEAGVDDILIHAITDGRDTSPTGGSDYLATVCRADRQDGRSHRDGDWPLLCHGPRRTLGS